MNVQQFAERDDQFARRYVYDDTVVVAADLDATDAAVDVLEDTVIVVTDDDQYELDVAGDPEAFMQNGVLTIEVNQ